MYGSFCRYVEKLRVFWSWGLTDLTAIFVGNAREWIPDLIERAQSLKITGGFEEGADL